MSQKKKTICSAVGFLCIAAVIVCAGELVPRTSMFRTVLQLGAIYALLAVSMNLCNGFTGLFSLGQAGFMTLALIPMPFSRSPRRHAPAYTIFTALLTGLPISICRSSQRCLPPALSARSLPRSSARRSSSSKATISPLRRSALRRSSASLSPPRRSTALRTALLG